MAIQTDEQARALIETLPRYECECAYCGQKIIAKHPLDDPRGYHCDDCRYEAEEAMSAAAEERYGAWSAE